MAFPVGLATVRLYSDSVTDLSGAPVNGKITLVVSDPPGEVTWNGKAIFLNTAVVIRVRNGSFSADVVPGDAEGLSATGWTYRVVEQWEGGKSYNIYLPSLVPVVNFAALIPTESSQGIVLAPSLVTSVDGRLGPVTLTDLYDPLGASLASGNDAKSYVDTKVTQEAATRATADTGEITDRISADSLLSTRVDSEVTLRTNADVGLDTRITAVEPGAGLYVTSVQKGAASGVATLDNAGLLLTSQLPPLAVGDSFRATSEAEMLALVAQRGDVAVRSDLIPAETFWLAADDPTVLANWIQITTAGAVTSVAGKVGPVLLVAADVAGVDTPSARDAAIAAQQSTETTARIAADASHTAADSGVHGVGSSTVESVAGATGLVTTHAAAADPHTDRAWAAGQFITLTQRSAPNGVPILDAAGLIPPGQIPPSAVTVPFTVASQAQMLALTAQRGDLALRTDLPATFVLFADPATVAANWVQLPTPTSPVLSVFGRLGNITGTPADVGAAPASGISPSAVAGTAVVTSDARLSDARTPLPHAASHGAGGTDVLTPAAIGTARVTVSSAPPPTPVVGDVWVGI